MCWKKIRTETRVKRFKSATGAQSVPVAISVAFDAKTPVETDSAWWQTKTRAHSKRGRLRSSRLKIFVNGFRKNIALIDKGKKTFKIITGDIMNKLKLTPTRLFVTFFLLCGLMIIQTPAAPMLQANGKIAFTSDRDGNSEIYLMNADGSGQTRLTNNSFSDDFPTWSPDGRTIAFMKQNGGVFSINLMNADGTNQTELTRIIPWNPSIPCA